MSAVSCSLVLTKNPGVHFSSSDSSLKPSNQCLQRPRCANLSFSQNSAKKLKDVTFRKLMVQASYGDSGRSSSTNAFVGGFILGGLIVGTLGCVYAPQISRALAGAPDKKDLMKKLPKFIYDEEKALERTRKVLAEKIAQLSSAIDDVSSQLHSEGSPNGSAVNSDEVEAAA